MYKKQDGIWPTNKNSSCKGFLQCQQFPFFDTTVHTKWLSGRGTCAYKMVSGNTPLLSKSIQPPHNSFLFLCCYKKQYRLGACSWGQINPVHRTHPLWHIFLKTPALRKHRRLEHTAELHFVFNDDRKWSSRGCSGKKETEQYQLLFYTFIVTISVPKVVDKSLSSIVEYLKSYVNKDTFNQHAIRDHT